MFRQPELVAGHPPNIREGHPAEAGLASLVSFVRPAARRNQDTRRLVVPPHTTTVAIQSPVLCVGFVLFGCAAGPADDANATSARAAATNDITGLIAGLPRPGP